MVHRTFTIDDAKRGVIALRTQGDRLSVVVEVAVHVAGIGVVGQFIDIAIGHRLQRRLDRGKSPVPSGGTT